MDFNFTNGLYLNRNSFIEVPPNTTEICINAFLNREGILQKRRGFYLTYKADEELLITNLLKYADRIMMIKDSKLCLLTSNLGAVETEYTSDYTVSSNSKTAVSNNNLYITSLDSDVLKLDTFTGTIKKAGVERSLDITAVLSGVSGVHPANAQANYRIVFGYTDKNNSKVVSAPSNLATVTNPAISASASPSSLTITVTSVGHGLVTGNSVTVTDAYSNTNTDVANVTGDYNITWLSSSSFQFTLLASPIGTLARIIYNTRKNAVITANLNTDVSEGWFCQIYRSSYSLRASVPALEDLQLVDEVTITSAHVSARLFTYTDEIPENLRRGFLYTNPSAEGIASSNTPPPASKCIAVYKNCLFFANVKERARKNITMVTVSLLVNGDTVSITTVNPTTTETLVYTASAAEDVATRAFRLRSDSSTSVNIDTTARSLCNVINRDTESNVTAYYSSGSNDLAGQIIIETKDFITDSFHINTTKPLTFSPSIPTTGSDYEANTIIESNKIMFSKIQEPEAVPLGNFLVLGSKSESIINVASLKDSLIILTDRAIYRLGGDSPSEFFIRVIDSSIRCVAENSVAVLNENVLFLSDRGVVAANENNVQIISENINSLLQNTLERDGIGEAMAYSYPSENAYFLSTLRENSLNAEDKVVYVYSATTGAWATVDTVFNSYVFYNNKVVLVGQDKQSLFLERKSRNMTDFCDYAGLTFTPTSFNPDNDTVRGTIVSEDVLLYSTLRSDTDFVTVRKATQILDNEYEFLVTYIPDMYMPDGVTFKEFEIDTAIETKIKTSPLYASDANTGIEVTKYFQEIQLRSRNSVACSRVQVQFSNNNGTGRIVELKTDITDSARLGWGFEPFGAIEWGSSSTLDRQYYTSESIGMRTYVDKEISRSQYLQIEITHLAPEPLDLQAVSVLVMTTNSKRIER